MMVVFGMIGSTLVMGVFAVLYVFPGNSTVERECAWLENSSKVPGSTSSPSHI